MQGGTEDDGEDGDNTTGTAISTYHFSLLSKVIECAEWNSNELSFGSQESGKFIVSSYFTYLIFLFLLGTILLTTAAHLLPLQASACCKMSTTTRNNDFNKKPMTNESDLVNDTGMTNDRMTNDREDLLSLAVCQYLSYK